MHRAALLGLIVLTGCQHTHLRHNTVHQAKTLSDVYEQQVMDNLARTVHDAHAIPFFAYPNEGTTSITDTANLSADPVKRIYDVLGVSFNRQGLGQWGLTPVSDPAKLQLMQCAYQRSVYGTPLDKCTECCELENKFEGRTAMKLRVTELKLKEGEKGKEQTELVAACDPATGKPYNVDFCQDLKGIYKHSDGKSYPVDESGNVTIAPDCNGPCPITCGWIHYGGRCDLPRDCCSLVGHHCGTYVWVDKCYRQHLSQLTLKILDYAVNDAAVVASREKQVKVKVDKFGRLTEDDKVAVGTVTATIGIGDQISSVLVYDECGLKSLKDNSEEVANDRTKAASNGVNAKFNAFIKKNTPDVSKAQTELLRKQFTDGVDAGVKARLDAAGPTRSEPSNLRYPKSRTVRPSDYGVSPIEIQRGQRALGRQ